MKKPGRKPRAGFPKNKSTGRGGTAAGEIKTTGAATNEHQTENSLW
jgi:hypothetical protein